MKIKITLAMLAIGVSALGFGCACDRPPSPAGQAVSPGMNDHPPLSPDRSPAFDPDKPASIPPG
jgi:hypothetical protein